jgi:hypothetical protein
LKGGGLDDLDGRRALVRESREWGAAYVASRGGADTVGHGWLELLKLATPKHMMAAHVGRVLLANPRLVINRKKRELSRLAKDYLALTKSLREDLVVLGLDRAPAKVFSLAEVLAQQAASDEAAADADEPPPAAAEVEAVRGGGDS